MKKPGVRNGKQIVDAEHEMYKFRFGWLKATCYPWLDRYRRCGLENQSRRQFQHPAQHWQYGMRARQPGELMQIDPVSVGLPAGFGVKEFKAACPVTGLVALKACSRATSRNAKDCLHCLIEPASFNILSIPVDGGSECRDAFEQTCEALSLPLFVLPPEKPDGWVALSEPMAPVVMSSTRCMKGR